MVDEMATLIPTIPMNIRAEGQATQGSNLNCQSRQVCLTRPTGAFPPADTELTRLFHDMALSENPVQRLFLFFKLLFERVRNLAQGFKKKDFVTRLYHYFDYPEKRANFYANLSSIMSENPVCVRFFYYARAEHQHLAGQKQYRRRNCIITGPRRPAARQ